MSRLITTIAISCAAAILGFAPPARADTGGSAHTDGGGIDHGAEVDSGTPGNGGGSESGPVCRYTLLPIPDDFPVFDEDTGQQVETDGTGQWYEKVCDGNNFFGAVYISRRNPAELLDQARRYLPLPLPEPHLSPAGDQIVNLPSWLWVGGWEPERSSVSVPGITVTVTAHPESVFWSMGDGTTVVCNGAGTPYDPNRPEAEQTPTCTHTFRRSSASQPGLTYPLAVTVRWRASWDVSGFPGGGALGTIDRTTTVAVRVGEVQSINTRAS